MPTFDQRPDLWQNPPGYNEALRLRVRREWIECYLKAKRAYYCPDHPDVQKEDVMSDERFDMYEDSIKRNEPGHAVLELVGWDDGYMEYVCSTKSQD